MKARFVVFLFLLFPLILTSCSQAPQPESAFETIMKTVAVEAPAATEAPALAPAELAATAAPPESAKPQNSELALPNPSAGRMIIKDGLLDMVVADPNLAIERVTSLAADQGGYLVSSRAWMETGYKNAELRMGVPSAHFEDTLSQLRRMAVEVLNEETSGQDVSADYADLEARLVNLEATAARVRTFLDNAKTVEESLKINATLSDLEKQIEQVKGQMKFYEGRSAYSTITVLIRPQRPTPTATLTPTATATPTSTPRWNPGKTVNSASKVMVEYLQGGIDLLIWAVFLLWPFVLVGVIAWLILRRVQRKSAKTRSDPESKGNP
jgi:hypothetical protein